jgi:hypothetical protein
VSLADNLIKPLIIHGRARLHPLLVLVSVLGALKVIGLWGIFVGPMVAAFFYTLLRILHRELHGDGRGAAAVGLTTLSSAVPTRDPEPRPADDRKEASKEKNGSRNGGEACGEEQAERRRPGPESGSAG